MSTELSLSANPEQDITLQTPEVTSLSIEVAAPFLQGASRGRGPLPANTKHLTPNELNDYTRAAEREIRGYAGDAKHMTVRAMRIGRGVPVPLSTTQLLRLIRAVTGNYDMDPTAEVTVVTSPIGISDGLLEKLSASGVNRVEMEMHSSDEGEIALMGGEYDHKVIEHAFEVIGRSKIPMLDIVLTIGIPGQSMATLRESILFALSAHPGALSLRPLFLRDDTTLAQRYAQGEEGLPEQFDINEIMTMSQAPGSMLAQYGYRQYYPGRFAKEGCESKGALLDINSVDLMGYGCGATSRFDGFTFECTDDFDQYVAHSTDPAAIYVNIRRLNKPKPGQPMDLDSPDAADDTKELDAGVSTSISAESTHSAAKKATTGKKTPSKKAAPSQPQTPASTTRHKTSGKVSVTKQVTVETLPAKKPTVKKKSTSRKTSTTPKPQDAPKHTPRKQGARQETSDLKKPLSDET